LDWFREQRFLTSNNNPEWQIASAGSLYQYSILALANASVNVAQGAVSLSGYGVAWVVGAVFRDLTYITLACKARTDSLLVRWSNRAISIAVPQAPPFLSLVLPSCCLASE